MRRAPLGLVALLVSTAVTLTGVTGGVFEHADADAPTALADGTTITVDGHGYGHGHGMSQYGAEGAAKAGLDVQKILAFYYPKTTVATVRGNIRVLISEHTGANLVVQAMPGLEAQQVGTPTKVDVIAAQPDATRFRLVPSDGGTELDALVDGTWTSMQTFGGDAQFTAGGTPIRLYIRKSSALYRGSLRLANASTAPKVVDVVGVDNYVKGVVPREMPASWQPAAVQAQAVAARTYAVFERAENRGNAYDICDTSSCQVYGGYTAEQAASNAAVRATKGEVLEYDGSPAFTQFAASNGGYALSGGQPYLVSEKDPYDSSSVDPYANWSTPLTLAKLENRWPSVGDVAGITTKKVAGTGGHWASSVTIVGTSSTVTVSADSFRLWAGLRSDEFSIALTPPVSLGDPSTSPSPNPSPGDGTDARRKR